jgi:hypothetical protein
VVLVPIVLVASVLVTRVTPTWARPPVLWALGTSSIITIYAWPFVRGYGTDPRVPSLLARDYAAGVGAYVAVVVVIAAAWALLRRRAGSRAPGT